MVMNVYAVRDIKSGFLQPTLDVNDDVAARNFKYAITHEGTLEFANVQDFDLFHIGTYDNDTGVLAPIDKELVVEGASLVRGEK